MVFLEFRGNGRSTAPPDEPLNSFDCADDIEELRMYLELTHLPSLMGHANGATIALWYAIRYPEGVQKIALINHNLDKDQMKPRLHSVKAKVLMIAGTGTNCKPRDITMTHDSIKDSEIIVYEQAGYFPWVGNAETFFRKV